jgi:hypothetical protein
MKNTTKLETPATLLLAEPQQVGNDFPLVADWEEPAQLDDEQLATFVAEGAVRVAVFCEALKPFYFELRERFRSSKKSKKALIHGAKTWDEYCEKVLDRTRRAINYWLAGGNPGNGKVKAERKAKKLALPESAQSISKPSFAISHSPIDDSKTWAKEDAVRHIISWTLSSIKRFTLFDKRQIVEDVIGKLKDEIYFETKDAEKAARLPASPNGVNSELQLTVNSEPSEKELLAVVNAVEPPDI